MTTHYRTEEVPATTRQIATHTTCDLCGAQVQKRDTGDYDECKIERRKGFWWPEGADHDRYEIDMCGECFATKLTPWLESQGVKVRKSNHDY